MSRRRFVASGVGAGIALVGLRFPGLATGAPTNGAIEALTRIVISCASAYGVDAPPAVLADGLRNHLHAAGGSSIQYANDATSPTGGGYGIDLIMYYQWETPPFDTGLCEALPSRAARPAYNTWKYL